MRKSALLFIVIFLGCLALGLWLTGTAHAAVANTPADLARGVLPHFDVRQAGLKGDFRSVSGIYTDSGSSNVDSAAPMFTLADVGRKINIVGAGTGGALLTRTITAYVSSTRVTVDTAVGNNTDSTTGWIGYDNRTVLNSLISNIGSTGTIVFNRGTFFIGSNITIPAGVTLRFEGDGKLATNSTVTVLGPIECGARQCFETGVGETERTNTLSITDESAVVTATDQMFVSTDEGRTLTITNAGITGGSISATIITYSDSRHVTLGIPVDTVTPGATITGQVGVLSSRTLGGTISLAGNTSLERINGKWWGATGDNSTNDQPTAQAALDAAYSAGTGPMFVYFPKGNYRLKDTTRVLDDDIVSNVEPTTGLTYRSNVSIDGAGQGITNFIRNDETLKRGINGADNDEGILLDGTSHASLHYFTYDGNELNFTEDQYYGVSCDDCTDIEYDHLEIKGTRGKTSAPAVGLAGARGGTQYNVHDNYIHDCGTLTIAGATSDGMYIGASLTRIISNRIERITDTGIVSEGKALVYGTSAEQAAYAAGGPGSNTPTDISATALPAANIVIANNILKDNPQGIAADIRYTTQTISSTTYLTGNWGEAIAITGNTVDWGNGANGAAIWVWTDGGQNEFSKATVTGNTVKGTSKGYGIFIDRVRDVIVTGNTVHDIGNVDRTNSSNANYLAGATTPVPAPGIGISLASRVTITGNQVKRAGTYGITFQGCSNVVCNNNLAVDNNTSSVVGTSGIDIRAKPLIANGAGSYTINSITPSTSPTHIVFSNLTPHPIRTGDRITLTDFNNSALNGTFTATKVSNLEITIPVDSSAGAAFSTGTEDLSVDSQYFSVVGNQSMDTRATGSKTQDYGIVVTNNADQIHLQGNYFKQNRLGGINNAVGTGTVVSGPNWSSENTVSFIDGGALVGPTYTAVGSDTNININFLAKGTGLLQSLTGMLVPNNTGYKGNNAAGQPKNLLSVSGDDYTRIFAADDTKGIQFSNQAGGTAWGVVDENFFTINQPTKIPGITGTGDRLLYAANSTSLLSPATLGTGLGLSGGTLSYTDSDTLATVTGRGATTSTASSFTGGLGVGVTPGAASFLEVDRPDVTSDSERTNFRSSSYKLTVGASTAPALVRGNTLIHPIITSSSSGKTVAEAATLYIDQGPSADATGGFTPTITESDALWVDSGNTRLDGPIVAGSTLTVAGATTHNGAVTNAAATNLTGVSGSGDRIPYIANSTGLVTPVTIGSGLSFSGGTLSNTGLTSNPTLNAVTTAGSSTSNSISTGAITAPSLSGTNGSISFDAAGGVIADGSSSTNKTFVVANTTHLAGNAQWRGTATVLSAGTSTSVTFGTAWAGAPAVVIVTPKSDPAVRYWVSSISTTGFTINTSAAPGADTDFMWLAIQ